MNSVFGFPEIVRFSWSSCSRILEELAVPVNWNDPSAEDDPNLQNNYKKRSVTSISSKQTSLKCVVSDKNEKENNYLTAYKCKNVIDI